MEWHGTVRLFAHLTLDMTYLVSHLERCRLDLSRSKKDANWECGCWSWEWRRLKDDLLTKVRLLCVS
jgi:hypothetical protein